MKILNIYLLDFSNSTNSFCTKTQIYPKFRITQKKLAQLKLPVSIIQVILGGLLGDGCINISKGYKNARYSFRHSIIQKEWFLWKAQMLKNICAPCFIFEQKPDGYSSKKKLRFQSKAHPILTELHNIVCKKGTKKVQRHWLNHLTPLALMVWWLDDGSIISKGRKGVLCTDNLSCEEINLLRRYLFVVWNIETNLLKIKNKTVNEEIVNVSLTETKNAKQYTRLYFSSTIQLKKFLLIIMPYIPVPEMLYKVKIIYKNPNYQQRWISDVKKALPQFHSEIDQMYSTKLN